MAAKKANKQDDKEQKTQEPEVTEKQETSAPAEKQQEEKKHATHYYVRKDYPRGVFIGMNSFKLRAGQKIDDLALAHQLRGSGVDLVESLAECDLFGLGD